MIVWIWFILWKNGFLKSFGRKLCEKWWNFPIFQKHYSFIFPPIIIYIQKWAERPKTKSTTAIRMPPPISENSSVQTNSAPTTNLPNKTKKHNNTAPPKQNHYHRHKNYRKINLNIRAKIPLARPPKERRSGPNGRSQKTGKITWRPTWRDWPEKNKKN